MTITLPYIDSKSLVLPKPIEALTTLAWDNHRSKVRKALDEADKKKVDAEKLALWNGGGPSLYDAGDDDGEDEDETEVAEA